MILLPTIIGFLATFGVYKHAVATDADINTLSHGQVVARRGKIDRISSLIIGLPVAGIALSVLLWLGPDGVEVVRTFLAPRVVVVTP